LLKTLSGDAECKNERIYKEEMTKNEVKKALSL
jgi:hypothetical protein